MDIHGSDLQVEVAAVAARLVVDEGLDYGGAKRQAVKLLGLGPRTPLPSAAVMDAAVREHIAIFCGDTQPVELLALRELALVWLDRLAEFTPFVGGAVWHGTATRHSDVYIQLFCEDPKVAEWRLIDRGVDYLVSTVHGWKGEPVDALSLRVRCEPLAQWVQVHLMVYDRDDVRGALKPDAQGRKPRGDAQALRGMLVAGGSESI
ncbi:hypothetical protein [Hydrogenophaga sp. PAMC20947]|uniref:hypothetical protein n=1 Tax=Hydrogenophaga sp. PAMC20947 TaxID=2565558 RepID=UPI00109DA9C9|nr:hypothetical protein [Hydrogenophaga sp. PAMC20947]QCB48206.1 hypothetical protein E5678_20565 [Hydrogenophaga sp. PAMC20947]